jgi:hypothetical protein
MLRSWRGGPQAGKPKLSPAAKGLLERGLMRLDTTERLPRLFFTDAGLAELRAMMMDRRFADPKKFAQVRQEFGIDPMPDLLARALTEPLRVLPGIAGAMLEDVRLAVNREDDRPFVGMRLVE